MSSLFSRLRRQNASPRPTRRRLLLETLENRSLMAVTPVQVLLMIGQSNMGGYPSTADLEAPLDAPQEDVWIWQDDLQQNVGWTSLRGGFGGDSSNFSSGGNGAQFGPEVSLGRSLADASPESQYAIIKHVQGGTMQDGWNPDRGGGAGPGQNWIDFVNKTSDALDELGASQLDYEIAGLFVFQGSRDAGNETGVEAANYEQNFTDFISGVRQQFAVPQMPVVITELPEYRVVGSGASGYGNTLLVRNGQKAVDAAVPLTTIIEANDFSRISDGTHFDAEGQIGLGQRFADAYLGVPFEGSARVGSDGFESGSLTSGFEQWAAGAWTAAGNASVTTAGVPFDNAYHVRLTSSTGELTRAVDSTGLTNEKLRFWSKLESFESGDKASVKVSADGANWTTVREFADGEDDNVYRYQEIDLPDIGNTIYVRFDADMNDSTDYWYIDDVIIEGTTPPGSAEFSISDATANEGLNLTPFTVANTAILDHAADLAYGPSRNGDAIADLYVIGRFSDNIVVYDGLTGAFVEQFVAPASGLDKAAWLMFGPNGDLYTSTVTASGNRDVVLRIDQSKTVNVFIADSTLTGAKGMAFGPDGNFYLADVLTNRVAKYNGQTGQFIDDFVPAGSGLDQPAAVIFGPDRTGDSITDLYVSSSNTDQVFTFDGQTGAPLGAFVAAASGGLNGPGDMEFGPDGNLYVVSNGGAIIGNEQVYRFNGATGDFIDVIVPPAGIAPETSFITFDSSGNLLISSENSHDVLRYSAGPLVSLSEPSAQPVTVDFSTADGSATQGADYGPVSGRFTFAPGETTKRILVSAVNDVSYEANETYTINLSNPVGGVIIDGQGIATIVDNDFPTTKFYVVNDGSPDRTFEYGATGVAVENYAINSGNTAPRGAASTTAGDKVWVVDANWNVYVYGPDGNSLGSWSVGGFNSSAQLTGIATNGTDIWIVDAKSDKVYRFTGAASRLTGSQSAASSFALNSGNKDSSDLVTDGTSIWVLNNTSTDKVFKYTLSGSSLGSWTISSAGGSPTGITLDPSNVNHLWIVDSSSDRVYQFDSATSRTSGSQSPSTSFALSSSNTNPQGLADPPASLPLPLGEGRGEGASSHDFALLSLIQDLDSLLPTAKRRR